MASIIHHPFDRIKLIAFFTKSWYCYLGIYLGHILLFNHNIIINDLFNCYPLNFSKMRNSCWKCRDPTNHLRDCKSPGTADVDRTSSVRREIQKFRWATSASQKKSTPSTKINYVEKNL